MTNPFNLSSVSQFRDGAPVYQDPYRTFFLAKLTAKTLVGSVYNYDWTEQSFDTATGAATDANPCRSGSYAAGVANSPAVEANNANIDVTSPVYVFLKQKGIVNGQVYYEFQYTQVSSSSTVSAWKEPVRVATTTAGTLASSFENGDTVDGVTLATGDRILLKNQASGAENGPYTVNASGAPTRATDCDTGSEFVGATVFVSQGTVNADTYWTCTTNAPITVGVTATVWAQTPGANQDISGYMSTGTQVFRGTKTFTNQPSSYSNPGSVAITPGASPYIEVYGDGSSPTTRGYAFIASSANLRSAMGLWTGTSYISGGPGGEAAYMDLGHTTGGTAMGYYVSSGGNSYGVNAFTQYSGGNFITRLQLLSGAIGTADIRFESLDPLGTGAQATLELDQTDVTYVTVKNLVTTAAGRVYAGASGGFSVHDGAGTVDNGVDGTFTAQSGETITVKKGIITSIV